MMGTCERLKHTVSFSKHYEIQYAQPNKRSRFLTHNFPMVIVAVPGVFQTVIEEF